MQIYGGPIYVYMWTNIKCIYIDYIYLGQCKYKYIIFADIADTS